MTNQDVQRIADLLSRHRKNELSAADEIELRNWVKESNENLKVFEELTNRDLTLSALRDDYKAQARVEKEIRHRIPELNRVEPITDTVVYRRMAYRKYWLVAASVVLILVALSVERILFSGNTSLKKVAPQLANDVGPGTNRAVLTLANGSTIVLDSAGNGALTRQGNTQVLKLNSGEIAYRAGEKASAEALYNTITTPRGGQYKLVLPDGSRVWLNAATTLRFPISFMGAARSVELIGGEAYFEIEHHAAQPFTVRVHSARSGDKDLAVQVLGTSFDIDAYPDEPATKATLLTGSVRVSKGATSVLLHPGEQAAAGSSGEAISINRQVDVAGTVAWKDGLFSFDRAGIEVVMRQLARWYDVEVGYEGAIPSHQFVGSIPRNVPASVVLKALEYNNVHFRIEGKKIIVTP